MNNRRFAKSRFKQSFPHLLPLRLVRMAPSMTTRQAQELGDAMAFLAGERGPLRCGWCDSEDVTLSQISEHLDCWRCHRQTSRQIAYELRESRERARIERTVGGPIVEHFQ